ncbi:MAG: hypothetical protein V1735_06955 [Nanoarchaeota archaeon]
MLEDVITLAEMLNRQMDTPKYQRVKLLKGIERLETGRLFYKMARSLVDRIEEGLVFGARKPLPVPTLNLSEGEEVLVTDPSHPWYDHWVTYYDLPDDGYHAGPSREEAQRFSLDQISRGLGAHEIVIDSYLSFRKFLNELPRQIIQANPFVPIEKAADVGDLVYIRNVEPNERFCRVEEVDGNMYKLFTLHRAVHKTIDISGDGFVVLAAAGEYDPDLFQKPFLNFDQVAAIVGPIAQQFIASPEFREPFETMNQRYRELARHYLQEGMSIPGMVTELAEHRGDISLFLSSMGVDPTGFIETYVPDFTAYTSLFDRYRGFSRDLIERVALSLGITEDELFQPQDPLLFPGARVRLKDDPREKGNLPWNDHPAYAWRDGTHVSLTGVAERAELRVDFGYIFAENGSRCSNRRTVRPIEIALLDKDEYLEFNEPEDLVRLVALMQYQIQKRQGNGDARASTQRPSVDLQAIIHERDEHYGMHYGNDLFSKIDQSEENCFNDPLLRDTSPIATTIPLQLYYVGFTKNDLKLVYDYLFPGNEWAQLQLSRFILDSHIVFGMEQEGRRNERVREILEDLTTGRRPDLFGGQLNLMQELGPELFDSIHALTGMMIVTAMRRPGGRGRDGYNTIGDTGRLLQHMMGTPQADMSRLAGFMEHKLFGSTGDVDGSPYPAIGWPGSISAKATAGGRQYVISYQTTRNLGDMTRELFGYMAHHFHGTLEQTGTRLAVTLADGKITVASCDDEYVSVEYCGTEVMALADDRRLSQIGQQMRDEKGDLRIKVRYEEEGSQRYVIQFEQGSGLIADVDSFMSGFMEYMTQRQQQLGARITRQIEASKGPLLLG